MSRKGSPPLAPNRSGGHNSIAGAATSSSPTAAPSTVPRSKFNELMAENLSLRARMTSSHEELNATREIFSRSAQGGQRAPSRGLDDVPSSGGAPGLSLRWLSQVPPASAAGNQHQHDEDREGAAGPYEEQQQQGGGEIRALRIALAAKQSECDELRQQQIQHLRGQSPGSPIAAADGSSPSNNRRRGSSRVVTSKSQPSHDGPHIVSITEELAPGPSAGGDDALVGMLQLTLQQTKGQLRQALEELSTTQSKYRLLIAASPPHQQSSPTDQECGANRTPRQRNVSSTSPQAAAAEREEVLIAKEAARLFRLYDRPFSVEEISKLLDSNETSSAALDFPNEDGGDGGGASSSPGSSRQKAMIQQISASLALREELDACQSELVAAHERIDELSFALELEQRHVAQLRFNQVTSSNNADVLINSEAAKQAAEEIAFLCDTLAATREEADRLEKSLQTARLERDAALAAFSELKQRSEEVLFGCHEISETARIDADSSIQVVMMHLKAKEKDLHLLRNQYAQHKIVFEDLKKVKIGLEKELIETKTKNLSLKEMVTKLQEEHRRSTVTIADLRARVTSLKSSQAQQQQQATATGESDITTDGDGNQRGVNRRASPASSTNRRRVASANSRGKSAEDEVEDGGAESPMSGGDDVPNRSRSPNSLRPPRKRSAARKAAKQHSTDLTADDGSVVVVKPQRDLTANIPRSFRPAYASTPATSNGTMLSPNSKKQTHGSRSVLTASDSPANGRKNYSGADGAGPGDDGNAEDTSADNGGINYRVEYEEMKSCLLLLAPKVPGATTARDVTSGLLDGLEKITVHCQKVETELRKKSTQFQVLKRQHAETREQVEALERKVAHVSVLEKKIESKDRLLDKTKKEHATVLAELTKQRVMLDGQVAEKANELERLRAELAVAHMELSEGRELMLQLIKESEASRSAAGVSSPAK